MSTTTCPAGTTVAIVMPDPLSLNHVVAIRNGVRVEGDLGAGISAYVDVAPTSGPITVEALEPVGAWVECREPGWTTSTTSTTVVEDVVEVAQADTLPVTGAADTVLLFTVAAVLAVVGLALSWRARRPGGAR